MIYVDDLVESGAAGKYRGKDAAQAERVGARNGHRWCHLFADEADSEELHAFARRIGMRREWFQRNHYDLTPGRRAAAVKAGAREVNRRESVAIWRKQRAAPPGGRGGAAAMRDLRRLLRRARAWGYGSDDGVL